MSGNPLPRRWERRLAPPPLTAAARKLLAAHRHLKRQEGSLRTIYMLEKYDYNITGDTTECR